MERLRGTLGKLGNLEGGSEKDHPADARSKRFGHARCRTAQAALGKKFAVACRQQLVERPGQTADTRRQPRGLAAEIELPALQQPEAYIGGAEALFDSEGNPTQESTSKFLMTFLNAFAGWIETQLRAT